MGGAPQARATRAKPLDGRVALVAGATRGAGRGIAVALGEAGATVYCSGRSVRGSVATAGRSETIDETADLVTAAARTRGSGGRGIAVQCDHTKAGDVESLVRRIELERGRLDVLVNDVWGGDDIIEWGKPFDALTYSTFPVLLERAVLSHVLTAQKAAPLLREAAMEHGRALLVEITDGDSYTYRGNLLYDLVKTSVIRLAWAFHEEFRTPTRAHDPTAPGASLAGEPVPVPPVHAVAVTPGFLRSEAMLDRFGVSESNWQAGAAKDPHFAFSETPLFVGRAVAALAAASNDDLARKSGRVFASWTLAREYGFTDADGSRPDWGAHFREAFGDRMQRPCDDGFYGYWEGWQELAKRL